MRWRIRPAGPDDQAVLELMLYYAAHLDHEGKQPSSVHDDPAVAKYVAAWGRAGDLGYVGEDDTTGDAIGAAWMRIFRADDAAYGFVDERTPELAIGVRPTWRGQGVGSALLSQLLDHARARYTAVSLSVRASNPAVRLYERHGFQRFPSLEVPNPRAGSDSFTMLRMLGDTPSASTSREPS